MWNRAFSEQRMRPLSTRLVCSINQRTRMSPQPCITIHLREWETTRPSWTVGSETKIVHREVSEIVGFFGWILWLDSLVGFFGWILWLDSLVGFFGWILWLDSTKIVSLWRTMDSVNGQLDSFTKIVGYLTKIVWILPRLIRTSADRWLSGNGQLDSFTKLLDIDVSVPNW